MTPDMVECLGHRFALGHDQSAARLKNPGKLFKFINSLALRDMAAYGDQANRIKFFVCKWQVAHILNQQINTFIWKNINANPVFHAYIIFDKQVVFSATHIQNPATTMDGYLPEPFLPQGSQTKPVLFRYKKGPDREKKRVKKLPAGAIPAQFFHSLDSAKVVSARL